MDKKYNFQTSDAFGQNLPHNLFEPHDKTKPLITMVLPPPNVTGQLHLGHTWDNTLADCLMRYYKMQGFNILWIPGTDHAGIATEAKVLQETKQTRTTLGRDKLLALIWDYVAEKQHVIHQQWRTLGLSLAYDYEKFTLDPIFAGAVTHTFLAWYDKKLIYEATKMINWDPLLETALSDIEVVTKPTKSKLYYCCYQAIDSKENLIVATSRPETIFADQCLFVHPADERYLKWHNRQVINPLNQKVIPVLVDEYVDPTFGSGVLKCTPGHDFNDYELGVKHGLKVVVCLDEKGKMNSVAGEYEHMDRFACRTRVVAYLKQIGSLAKIESYVANIGYSERSNVIVEPYLSKQWFLKTQAISEAILKAQTVTFFPFRMNDVLTRWLTNINDWCLSRQIWWGHQLPVYKNPKTKQTVVQQEKPTPHHNWEQTYDVLDTWFSSGIWPLVATGWRDNKDLFARAFPTSFLVCGSDIIFFWVARMMIQSKFLLNKLPFSKVVVHGLVRDQNGLKMSKSLNNGVDPQTLFAEYGIDAVRLFLNTSVSLGNDLKLQPSILKENWNFLNKLWNITRYVKHLVTEPVFLTQAQIYDLKANQNQKFAMHRWILSQLHITIDTTKHFWKEFALNHVYEKIYHFLWDDFAAFFVEFSKQITTENEHYQSLTKQVLTHCLLTSLQLLHPLVPFITEYLWSQLGQKGLIVESEILFSDQTFKENKLINSLLMLISLLRRLQMNWSKERKQNSEILLSFEDGWLSVADQKYLLYYLQIFFSNSITLIEDDQITTNNYEKHHFTGGFCAWLKSDYDQQNEEITLVKEQQRLATELQRSAKLMNNQNFLQKADPQKVHAEKTKYEQYQKAYAKITQMLADLKTKQQ